MPSSKKNKTPAERDIIYESLVTRGQIKQVVMEHTKNLFHNIMYLSRQIVEGLQQKLTKEQIKLEVGISEKSPYEIEVRLNDEILIFYMHSNVFMFDQDHYLWQSPYVQDDLNRGFCGMIMIYNFLADSFRYNRNYDTGYLIGRIFVNKDEHVFVEGKRQLGFLYNDFENNLCTNDLLNRIVESAYIYALNFETLVPPYDIVKELTVLQKIEQSGTIQPQTGKRMGFRFSADKDDMTR
ncbi:MAG: hypothetical protein KJS45_11100 [Bacteroidetes bacterium]|nr:hypothetical protein [Bacteroidota bacterium]GDX48868.1 hypothetical protein LBMAG25_16860 [Bacteroidota bacterium]